MIRDHCAGPVRMGAMPLHRGLLLLVLLLAGCSAPAPAAPASGSAEHTLRFGGLSRTYRTYRPAVLPIDSAVPLVVVLHGGMGSGKHAERAYGWDARADRGQFVVAYPDGVGRTWNAGPGCCGPAVRDGVDDVGFLEQLIAAVGTTAPIDPARVYVTGMSNGGMMAYRLACESTRFAAIAPVAGTLVTDCPRPPLTSVLHIHGTADPTVPYDGGPGNRNDGRMVNINGPAVPDLIASWRAAGGCGPPTEGVAEAVTTSITACPGGREIELVTIAGAAHKWPGTATDTIWSFFSRH